MHSIDPKALALGITLAGFAAAAQAEDVTSNLRINGFATAGASWVSKDFGGEYISDVQNSSSGIDEKGSLTNDNVLGLQVTYELADKFDIVGQLVSAGRENYDTRVEWAYLAYQATDKLRLRAGRFAAPLFMFSESVRVGQAYPWSRPPQELYTASRTFSSVDGLDLLYRQPIGSWNMDTQLTAGGSNINGLEGKVEQFGSLNLTLSNGALTLHGGYSATKVDLHWDRKANGNAQEQLAALYEPFGVDLDLHGGDSTFADFGVMYDDGNWFAAAEYGQMRVEGYIPDYDAGYVSVGHYFGKWLPYLKATQINNVNAEECQAQLAPSVPGANQVLTQVLGAQGLAQLAFAQTGASGPPPYGTPEANLAYLALQQINQQVSDLQGVVGMLPFINAALCAGQEQTSYSAGFRYDATKNVSVKFEVEHVQDFNGTTGLFSSPPPADESAQVFTFNVNATF